MNYFPYFELVLIVALLVDIVDVIVNMVVVYVLLAGCLVWLLLFLHDIYLMHVGADEVCIMN
jgi:hypothetical protein